MMLITMTSTDRIIRVTFILLVIIFHHQIQNCIHQSNIYYSGAEKINVALLYAII